MSIENVPTIFELLIRITMICIHKLRVVTEQQACAYPQFIFLQNPEGVKHTRKNLEVKKEKEREEKQDSFLPGYLPITFLAIG